MIFDTPTSANDSVDTYVSLSNCDTRTHTDNNWTEIDFVDGVTGLEKNVSFGASCTTIAAGSIAITPRTGGTNAGYGPASASDTRGILNWQ